MYGYKIENLNIQTIESQTGPFPFTVKFVDKRLLFSPPVLCIILKMNINKFHQALKRQKDITADGRCSS